MVNKILLALIISFLMGCHHHENKTHDQTFTTVYPKPNTLHLYYNGNIKPIQQDLVISPASGVISKIYFHYGEYVNQGDVLLTIHSPEMETEFREAISSYLRTKQAFLTSKKNMIGSEMLYKEKIISEQEFLGEQGQYRNNLLSYIEASTKLQQFLSNLPLYQQKISDLTTFDFDEAKNILQSKMEDLSIIAKNSGIVLFPEAKNSGDIKQLQIGSEVKKNDVLFNVGNLSGIAVAADVSENDINLLRAGAAVVITFASQPELELKGAIVAVAKQAKNMEGSGFSTFPIVVHVPKITAAQLQKIRVGLNAKLDILVEEPAAIKIPIKAVYQRDGTKYVKIADPVTGKLKEAAVETGSTSLYEVTIVRGLKQGDKVLLP